VIPPECLDASIDARSKRTVIAFPESVVVSVATEGVVAKGLLRQYHRLSPEDRRIFDKWLKANAIFGAILFIGTLAMGASVRCSSAIVWRSVVLHDLLICCCLR